jgi:hypothetical protein
MDFFLAPFRFQQLMRLLREQILTAHDCNGQPRSGERV